MTTTHALAAKAASSPLPASGAGGKAYVDFAGSADKAYEARILSDGSIVVGGHAGINGVGGVENDFGLVRLTPAGILDTSFGAAGNAIADIAGRTDLAYAADLHADGRIVLAGRAANGGGDTPEVGLARFNQDGSLDASFGNAGKVQTALVGNVWNEASDILVQPDGRTLVSAQVFSETHFKFAVARFDAGGRLDGGFGAGGVAITPMGPRNDYSRALALQPDGKIVVAGQTEGATVSDFGVARYDSAGTLDASFGTDGKLTVDFFGSTDSATCIAVQPDGKIVVAGLARNGATNGLGLVRLLP